MIWLQVTWGFAILGQDVVIFIISNMAAVVWAGQASVGFWLLFCTFVFQSAAVPGLTFFKFPNIAKPYSLHAILMRHFKLFIFIIASSVFLTACETERTPETFLLQDNFKGFFYIVYNKTGGQEKAFEQNRRLYKIPATGVLFTKFKNDWGSIKFENGVINQQFYFFDNNGKRAKIKVLDTGDFNNQATTYPKKEFDSKDSLAAFFISAGTISNGKSTLTTDQYYIGTYDDLTKTKDFTFQYIDSLRIRVTKNGM